MQSIAIATTDDDVAYVRASYTRLDLLVAVPADVDVWIGRALPRATYQLADGTRWFPRDWLRLVGDAGSIASVEALFARRYRAAAAALRWHGDLAGDWQAYLAGLFGACLRDVTPENIVVKAVLVARLERALAEPRPDHAVWCEGLRADTEALDGISRPFASCDRIRFGRPTSRDRLISAVRAAYPHAFPG